MNNTDKLLRAFIEASGYEIEETIGNPTSNDPKSQFYLNFDYKVTKKASSYIKCNKCGTHLAYNSPLDACLCRNNNNLERIT